MIISASRRTDIPAFYSEWFLNRLQEGYLYVVNPMNRKQISKINLLPDNIECIVFWTKNPENIFSKLPEINSLGYSYYFQFTVTSYDTSIEENVPRKNNIIETFKKLSSQIGPEKVVWRYDPIFITNKYSQEYHKKWFTYLANELSGYTTNCIISFIDMYKKCERNMKHIDLLSLSRQQKINLAKELHDITNRNNMILESCAESIEMKEIGINHGKCIDDKLISKIISSELSIKKDKNQRDECGCVASIDIGAYNSCNHHCKYCYANFNKKLASENFLKHDPSSPLLIGQLIGDEKITERKMTVFKSKQKSLF